MDSDSTLPEGASPRSLGSWPRRRSPVLDWLVNDVADVRYLDVLFHDFCRRLDDGLVTLARAALLIQTNHPEWLGIRIDWERGTNAARLKPFGYDVLNTDAYLLSPASAIDGGTREVRARLDRGGDGEDAFPLFGELRRQGLTDYVAWPLPFTLGKHQIVTFATDRTGGFLDRELEALRDILPVLASAADVRTKNRVARVLLDTYVGPHAGEAILAGATTRGSGFTVEAAILMVDLRGFTAISDAWPRDDVIALLNDYFDQVSQPIEEHGGEILKFMGDGLLAIFRGGTRAVERAVAAIRRGMATLNAGRKAQGRPPLGYGIGVNFGDVMYGNIGSRTRLDFTVIGPAVNVASRLETLTKTVGSNALFSAAFVDRCEDRSRFREVGSFPLQGVGRPLRVFALVDDAA